MSLDDAEEALFDSLLERFTGQGLQQAANQIGSERLIRVLWHAGLVLCEHALRRADGHRRETLLRNAEAEMRGDLAGFSALYPQFSGVVEQPKPRLTVIDCGR